MAYYEIRAFIDEFGMRVRLYVLDASYQIGRERKAYPGAGQEPVEFQDGNPPETFGYLNPDAAQALADDLWRAGFRPTAGKQSEGQVAATQAHLADMRALAFAKLNVSQP